MKIFLILITFLLVSCQKQSPSDLSPDYVDSLTELRRGEACRKVNLLENIVELENVRALFVCATWDEDFPSLFKALEEVSVDDWNRFANPVNTHLFNNRELRDNLISLIKELDVKGGLDELGKVITSLSDSNFFFHVNRLLNCGIDGEGCLLAEGIKPEEIWHFFAFFKMSPEELRNFSKLLTAFSFSFKGKGVSFVKALTENLKRPAFKKARNDFFHQMFLRMGDDDFLDELRFYESVLLTDQGDEGWLPDQIKTSFTREKFIRLMRHPVDSHKDLWKDFKILEKTLSLNIACRPADGTTGFAVNISNHLNDFVNLLFSDDQDLFFRTSLQSVAILKMAKQVCPELQGYGDNIKTFGSEEEEYHQVDFINLMEKTTSLLLDPLYFNFVQQLQESRPSKEEDNVYLIKYFSSNLFASFVELVKATTSRKDDLTSSLYDVFHSVPVEGYIYLKGAFDYLRSLEGESLKALSKGWRSLGEDGRFFFFNFLDAHYSEGTNLTLLFDFYSAALDVSSDSIPLVMEGFFNEEEKTPTLMALQNVSRSMAKEELLDEYRRFFSREHLLEILKIVSRGVVTNELSGNMLGNYVFEEPNEPAPQLSQTLIGPDVTKECLSDLVKPSVDFYDLINQLPGSCLPLRDVDPLFKFFDATRNMSVSIGHPFGPNGFFSPGLIKTTTQLLNSISKKYTNRNGEGLSVRLKGFSDWITKGKNKEKLINTFSLLTFIESGENDPLGDFSRFYGRNENFPHLKGLIMGLPSILKSYGQYKRGQFNEFLTESTYSQNEGLKCENYHKGIGGIPCPEKDDLKAITNRVISRALSKNDENPKALEQLVKMVAADQGLPIPYESSNPRWKRVTLKESFDMFFRFTDKTISTNRFNLEYGSIPKADKNYFETVDWEVDRKQMKGAPDPYLRELNTMERIEVVIRDVRFDENYLGAHYLNSVAKAEDYNKTVESKHSLLKACVPLKFCGKFMDKAQHRFAKNSKTTFLSLLDVNTKEGWRFGDYMQALLTSLVSTSPDKSQVSSIVNKRFLGLNIKIPWLNSKKILQNHNGKILGLVSMVGMFTNAARVLRDRVGESPEEIENFLTSEKLRKTDDGLFRNFSDKEHLPLLEKLLNKVKDSPFLEGFLSYAYESDYDQQRLWEQVVFKGLYLSSYLSSPEVLSRKSGELKKRYQDLSILDYLDLLIVGIDKHLELSETWNLRDKETLLDVNHMLDVTLHHLEKEDDKIEEFLHEMAYFAKQNKESVVNIMGLILSRERIPQLKEKLVDLKEVASDLSDEKQILADLINHISEDDSISWVSMQNFLRYNGARNICTERSEGYDCRLNPTYRELQKILGYLMKDNGENLAAVFDYISGPERSKFNELFKKIFPSINNGNL